MIQDFGLDVEAMLNAQQEVVSDAQQEVISDAQLAAMLDELDAQTAWDANQWQVPDNFLSMQGAVS